MQRKRVQHKQEMRFKEALDQQHHHDEVVGVAASSSSSFGFSQRVRQVEFLAAEQRPESRESLNPELTAASPVPSVASSSGVLSSSGPRPFTSFQQQQQSFQSSQSGFRPVVPPGIDSNGSGMTMSVQQQQQQHLEQQHQFHGDSFTSEQRFSASSSAQFSMSASSTKLHAQLRSPEE